MQFTEECDLEIGNITKAKGKVTWKKKGGKEKSAIDYILINDKIRHRIREMIIDEDGVVDTKSDHNMIITKYIVNENMKINKEQKLEKKWKRKNVDWNKYREEVDKARSIVGTTKEEILGNLYKVMRWAGERSVGYTKGVRENL